MKVNDRFSGFQHRCPAGLNVSNGSGAHEPPLAFVMEFNAAEREWHEARVRLNKLLEDVESCLAR
jgi:hypothetical protein